MEHQDNKANGRQAPVEVSLNAVLSSWMTRPVPSSATSRAQVRSPTLLPPAQPRYTNIPAVRENDILCLLESEREARRLR